MRALSSTFLATVALLFAGAALAAQRPTVVGDPAKDEAIYGRCLACHALDRNRTGPKHCGLFGRRAGSVADFNYSPAMRRSNIVWNEKTLDRFLANPLKAVPGTAMGYAGVTDSQERADLIAWLKEANASPAQCNK